MNWCWSNHEQTVERYWRKLAGTVCNWWLNSLVKYAFCGSRIGSRVSEKKCVEIYQAENWPIPSLYNISAKIFYKFIISHKLSYFCKILIFLDLLYHKLIFLDLLYHKLSFFFKRIIFILNFIHVYISLNQREIRSLRGAKFFCIAGQWFEDFSKIYVYIFVLFK